MSPARDQLYLTRIHHPRPLWSQYSSLAAHAIRMNMSGFTTSTPEQIAAAPQLEPSFEMTLRAADISEEVISGFRVHRIKHAATFAAMDTTPEELKDTVREAFGVDTAKYGQPHKVEWANIHNAWLASNVILEVKTRVDAVARAHGQPIQYLNKDLASMLFQFKTQHGLNIHEAKLPSQSYYESFEERRCRNSDSRGELRRGTRANGVKTRPPTQMGLPLDSTLTLLTKKRYLSRMPTDRESLRTKYRVMSNLWLLAQLRQPGRQLYADLSKDTFNDFLEEIIVDRQIPYEKANRKRDLGCAPSGHTAWNTNSSSDVRP